MSLSYREKLTPEIARYFTLCERIALNVAGLHHSSMYPLENDIAGLNRVPGRDRSHYHDFMTEAAFGD